MLAEKKKHVRSCAFVWRWRYCISRAYQVNYQAQGKWPNRYSQRYSIASSCSCEPFSILPFRMHKLIHKQCWYNPIVHPVLTSRMYLFSFIQILIDLYPLSREEFKRNSSSSHLKYFLIECTHVLSLMMPDKCGIDEDLYKQPFVFQ